MARSIADVFLGLTVSGGFGLLLASPAIAATPNPCALLTQAEVAGAFPGAKAGVPETTREKYGIFGCIWTAPGGRIVAQYWNNENPTTAKVEAESLVSGALDPFKNGAAAAVLSRSIPSVGQSAHAAIARIDAARGVLNDFAIVAVVVGDRTITIMSPELATRDPVKAFATLTALARSAATR